MHKHRSSGSWMYMSRLAALKEYTFMSALHEAGFRVPQPLAQNRHTIVMELIDAFPLRQISEVPDPAALYADLMQMIVDLAKVGLIHGDFNEFNILIREDAVEPADGVKDQGEGTGDIRLTPVLIDFPQMVSMSHENAEMYFTRDVDCIKRFFYRRFGFSSDDPGPLFEDAVRQKRKAGAHQIDVAVEASGFSKKMAKELDQYMQEVGAGRDGKDGSEEDEQDDDEEEEDGDEDGEGSGDNVGLGDELEADSSPNRGAESGDLSKLSGHQVRSEPTSTVEVT
jgi:RIO kinase 2